MSMGYKRLLCTLCAASAALCMTVTPARAEVCDGRGEDGCRLYAARSAEAAGLTVLAEDETDEEKKESSKSILKEQTQSSRMIYACIGGGVLVVIAVISLLAENMKKK